MRKFHLAPLALALAIVFIFTGKAHAYTEGFFVSDSYFVDSTGMSQSAIQSFLTTENGAVASQVFATPSNGNQSAAWIIYFASQHIGISPRTIMATMQKEQSLITTPATGIVPSQYTYAMGYGCPDTSSCSDPGFYNQVIDGSWQLRFDYERAGGNNGTWTGPDGSSWGSGISYPCAAKPSGNPWFYSTGLFPGATVNWSDSNNNIYATSTIANRSSAALYCYTPHAYKQGVYSGSFNFVASWDTWWGSSTFPIYVASYAGQSANPTVIAGSSAQVFLRYSNAGALPWYDDSSLGTAAAGTLPVHLATANPVNRNSIFSSTWPTPSRPANMFSAVYNSDGVTLAANQHVVQPGQIGVLAFTLSTSSTTKAGVYDEYFRPIAEGDADTGIPDIGSYIQVTVQAQSYQAAYYRQSSYPSIVQGGQASSYFDYTNNGNMAWYDDASVGSAPAGTFPVHLATMDPLNRPSGFAAGWGPDANRPASQLAAVFDGDGVTLAPNQHIVQPGQIGRFTFTIGAPGSLSPGAYKEGFQPVLDGSSVIQFGISGTYEIFTVIKQNYSASFVGESGSVSLAPGGQAPAYFMYKNSGNSIWYDDSSIATAPIGNYPVHLGTSSPINRKSIFSGTWPTSTRAAATFTAVYEADGVTLAANQHEVFPGQIAKEAFTFSAPLNQSPGVYNENFTLIAEGTPTGAFNDLGTYLPVDVQ